MSEKISLQKRTLSFWASLNARGPTEKDRALEIWLQYNKRLLKEFMKTSFPLLCFDWKESVLHKRFFDACEEMGLRVDRHQQDFFRHNYATIPKLVENHYSRRLRAHTNSYVIYMSVAEQC